MEINKIKKLKGFTLLELLIGITIFTILIGAISGIFIWAIRLQKRIIVNQEVIEELSYIIEYMSRTLRMTVRDDGVLCLGSGDLNYENVLGENSIKFINQNNDCQQFYLNTNKIYYSIGINTATPATYSITSDNIQVTDLKFKLSGSSSTNDELQPKVTIVIKAKDKFYQQEIKLQTTISQRNLDI